MTATPVKRDEQQSSDDNNSNNHRRKPCKIIMFLALIAVALCIAAFGYGYLRLAKVNLSLAETVNELKEQSADLKQHVSTMQTDLQGVDTIAQKSQQISQQQEQLLNEWRDAEKGDLNKWRLVDAQYLVQMANDQLKFAHNIPQAITLLREADLSLQQVQNAIDIRKAVAEDIAKLQALPKVDTTSLYVQLHALDKQVDSLPVISYPLKQTATQESTGSTTAPAELPWWKAGLKNAWLALGQLVVVQDTRKTALPLVIPDEKMFLYQNLHAQFANASWAVLQGNPTVYNNSLQQINDWITQYFNPDAEPVKAMLQSIADLQKIDITPSEYDLSSTVALFDQNFNQSKAS